MTISFDSIPSTLRVPFCSVEFNSSRAQQGLGVLTYKGILIGQKSSAGTAAANSIHRVTSADDVLTLAGQGSILHRMAMAWFASNQSTACYIGVLEDAGAGVVATKTLTFTGPASADGTLSLYVDGDSVPVAVADEDTAAEVAAAVVAALNAEADLPIGTAAVGGGGSEHIVTVPFKHKGAVGEDLDIQVNYQTGETLPAGIGVTIAAGTTGATNPTLTDLIAALGDTWFNIVAHPYTDATSLTAIETELASRWGPMRMIDGVAFTSANGSQGTLTTLGDGRNSKHSVIVSQPGENPIRLPCEFAAEVAAVVAYYGAIDPARPFTTLPLSWAKAPAEADLFTWQERDLLLHDGIATTRVESGGIVQLERIITTYQESPAGADDTAYLDVTTLLSLMYIRYSWRARVLLRFPRHKLADDGARFGSGQAVVTPKIMAAEALAWFRELEELGIVEDFAAFKAALVVERNATDPNRLDILLPPDLVNQLLVAATQVQFLL
jgi:phage tail sheath gpL-like